MNRPTVVIAGGGTGGHIFPAVAVAEAMQVLADVDIVLSGTGRGFELPVIAARGWALEPLAIEPIRGGGIVQVVRGGVVAARAMASALALVGRIGAQAVLSVGGYASGPVTLAAAMRGVPVAVLEPNRVVGLANRLIAPWAKRAYLAWEDVAPKFPAGTSRVFGVPLRSGFEPRPYVLREGARLLVLGGSQGAAALNERVPVAVGRLKGELPYLRVVHQTGHGRDVAVRDAYAREGARDVVVVPFMQNVASVMADADVVIARAGAGTIAEIAAIGRPSILVPYPHATDDHQRRNAEAMSQIGAARWLGDEAADPVRLATELRLLLGDRPARVAMAEASRRHGRPAAARDVAADLLALAGIGLRPLAEAS